MNDPTSVTQILSELSSGEPGAYDRLIPLVYAELRSIARAKLRHEAVGHTLDTTALVHEAYLRMVGIELEWADRTHFFAVCARTMRRVLLDHADRVGAKKRGGPDPNLPLAEAVLVASPGEPVLLLDLDRALTRLESLDERQCRIVECRLFADLSIAETAEALDISPATVKREWSTARAWLNRELER